MLRSRSGHRENKFLCDFFKSDAPSVPAKPTSPAPSPPCEEEAHIIASTPPNPSVASAKFMPESSANTGARRPPPSPASSSPSSSLFHLLNAPNYALPIYSAFDRPNSYVFNSVIRGLAENSLVESSILHYRSTMRSGIRPDRLTLPFVLKSAAALLAARLGRALHGATVRLVLEFDAFVRVSLVDMYAKVVLLNFAFQVFNESPERIKLGSVLLWNVLIYGYCKVGKPQKAAQLFEAMPVRNVGSWNCLINGYMRKGEMIRAGELFDQMSEKNVVS